MLSLFFDTLPKVSSVTVFSLLPLLPLVAHYSTEEDKETFPLAIFETTQGEIHIRLRPDIAPKACENFLKHAKNHYYDGVIFHRVIQDFMIQGGDPTGTGFGGESIWKESFEDECTPDVRFTEPGLLAMANAGPNTNRSQFFITTTSTPWLDLRHTIFGEVVKGLDVVHQIESVPVNESHKPLEEQKIVSIRIA